MGHRKYSAPRRGSLAYAPRRRAASPIPRVNFWPLRRDGVGLAGFLVYKVGMVTTFMIDDVPGSPTQGTEVAEGCTILAAPPLHIIGVALYKREDGYLVEVGRHIVKDLPPEIRERVRGVSGTSNTLDELKVRLGETAEVRAMVASYPREAGLPQKKAIILSVPVSGRVEEAFNYVSSRLGQRVSVEEVFKDGGFIDVVGVTRGRGFQGVVGRFGVKILPRKQRKTRRAVGAIGGRSPKYVTRFVPRAGQTGFHYRTEFNKRIVKIWPAGGAPVPKGGYIRAPPPTCPAVALLGSVMGPAKRPIILRTPARPPRYRLEAPKITTLVYAGEVLKA
ncbi:MAG: 50S ribosomal protein L3 [Nitrososphaerota archaeon]|nr:50S ribosomal protein L3 [Candidatus Calditenuaceae archaeon]MDW8072685.1 50S ribosomal protein L3 [Nitrososphaerota archaeon]